MEFLSSEDIILQSIFAKKGRGSLIRPWSIRTVVIRKDNKLQYYDNSELKGIECH